LHRNFCTLPLHCTLLAPFSSFADADDFDPDKKVSEVAAAAATAKPAATDKWDGEDADDDAKDEWDKSSGDEGDENRPRALQRKKKKKLEDILEEKAAKQKALLDAKATDSAAKKQMNTPEGRATERARLQKEQENSSYELAKDMMGEENRKALLIKILICSTD
jgi:translation initiation factor 3 subunit J